MTLNRSPETRALNLNKLGKGPIKDALQYTSKL